MGKTQNRPTHKQFITKVIAACFLMFFMSGCSYHIREQGVFARPALLKYKRLAVLGLSAEHEQMFMATYIDTFPAQPVTFVERGRLKDIISEQDLLPGRLDESKRAQVRRIFGVEALILANCNLGYYDQSVRIRVVDTETGEITASSMVKTDMDFFSVTYPSDEELIRRAVLALRR
jgi:hypothetical protein